MTDKEEIKVTTRSQIHQSKITQSYQQSLYCINNKKLWKKVLPSQLKANNIKNNSPKVLIVEDNQFNVLPIKSTLNRNHVKFDWAKNGLVAIDKFEETMKEG